jgi:hypothetical protein
MIIESIEAIPLSIPFKPGSRSAAGTWGDKNLRAFDSLLELFRPVVSTSIVLCALTFLLIAVSAQAADNTSEPQVKVDDISFKCITDMTPVRHFYVDNLLGNVEGTVAVAKADRGDYPEGSVLQLMPERGHDQAAKGLQSRHPRLGILLYRGGQERLENFRAGLRRGQQPVGYELLRLSLASKGRVRFRL